jgi:hypothetical protein
MTKSGKKQHLDRFVVVLLAFAAFLSAFKSLTGFGDLFAGCTYSSSPPLLCEADGWLSFLAFPLFMLVFFSRRIVAWVVCTTTIVTYSAVYNQFRDGCPCLSSWRSYLDAQAAWRAFWDYRVLASFLTAAAVVYAYRLECRKFQRMHGANDDGIIAK